MRPRPATEADAGEVVRLAALLFETMGIDWRDPTWQEEGKRHVRQRLGQDLAVAPLTGAMVTQSVAQDSKLPNPPR